MGTVAITGYSGRCYGSIALAVLLTISVTPLCFAEGILRMGVPTPPTTLDPRRASDAVSSRLCRLLYRRLVELDENYTPVPALATWEKLQPLHYRIHLGSKGRQFHDGSTLDAEDVIATYEWVLNAANASPFRGGLQNIQSINAVDANTIDFILKESDRLFPGRLALGIVPSSMASEGEPFAPIGSGSFSFVKHNPDGGVLLRRLQDGMQVAIMPVREHITRILKVARSELHMAQGDLPLALLPWLREQPNLRVQSMPGDVFSYIGINLKDEALADLKVRRAIAHAIDRQAVVRHLFYDTAEVAETLLPPWHWAANSTLPAYTYNPQLAKALLKEAGYSEQNPLRLEYKTSTDAFRIRLATVYQHQLAKIGIQLEVRPFEWGIFFGDIKQGRFQLYGLSWVGIKLPDIFHYAYHSSSLPPNGANRGAYLDDVTDNLIEQAQQADSQQAMHLYNQLQQRLHQQLPFIPLWHESQILVRQSNIKDYHLYRDGRYDSLATVRLVP